MKIYRGAVELIDVLVSDKAKETRELMAEHSISLEFELPEYLSLQKGDKITYNGKDFFLNKDYIPTVNKSTNGYKYDLIFYDITERFKDFKLKYSQQGVDELEFKLTASGDKFLDIVIYTLQKHGLGTFTKGQYPADIKEIHFENVDIFEGLNLIVETYGLEWWVDGNIINLGTLEFGEPVLLRYDTELDDISFSPSSEKLITRLYAFGDTRNIPYDYRTGSGSVDNIAEKRLRLPQGTDYIDLFPNLPENQIIEGVKYFDEIYPRQKNTITEVNTSTVGQTTIYTIKGNNTFTITQSDVAPGKPLMVAFQTGYLASREFELIIRENNKFEIKYEQNGSVYIPNPTLKPRVGDEFFFFNFKAETVLPVLITDAENELLATAQDFIDKIGSEYVFDAKTRSIYCEEHSIDLNIGQAVTIQSTEIGSITSRVRGYEKDLYNRFECTYKIGDSAKYSRLAEIEGRIKSPESSFSSLKKIITEGVVSETKYRSIEASVASFQTEFMQLRSQYTSVHDNDNLLNKVLLETAWNNYHTSYNDVINAINTAISDRVITEAERQNIQEKIDDYANKIGLLATAIENARASISIEEKNQIVGEIPLSWELRAIPDKPTREFTNKEGVLIDAITFSVQFLRSGVDVTNIMEGSEAHLYDFERENVLGIDNNNVTDTSWNAAHVGHKTVTLRDTDIYCSGDLIIAYNEDEVEAEYQIRKNG